MAPLARGSGHPDVKRLPGSEAQEGKWLSRMERAEALRLEQRALEIWQAREMNFPHRVRRMKPDVMDRATGAWDRCLDEACRLRLEIVAEMQQLTV